MVFYFCKKTALELLISKLSKKFGEECVFHGLHLKVPSGSRLSVLGANASGKSTFIRLIAGMATPSEGKIQYFINGEAIRPNMVFRHLAMAAPYVELINELTVNEMFRLYMGIKNPGLKVSTEECTISMQLQDNAGKRTGELSSGKRQRLKLGLALLSGCPLILLDEPLTNLDKEGISMYHRMIEELPATSTIIVCSNHQTEEYRFCQASVSMEDYHKDRK